MIRNIGIYVIAPVALILLVLFFIFKNTVKLLMNAVRDLFKQPEECPYSCDWCGEPGTVLGTSWGSLVVVHCDVCHHEWEDMIR